MAQLLEHEALQILGDNGVDVPEFLVATSAAEAAKATAAFGGESVLKALIPTKGRAAAGAVRIARSAEEAWTIAEGLLGEKVLGFRVDRILVSRLVEAEWEISVLFAPDPETDKPMLFASALGGIDIAEVVQRDPGALIRRSLESDAGVSPTAVREVAQELGLGSDEAEALIPALQSMYRVFTRLDARMLEINPLMIGADRAIVAPTATLVLN